MPLLSPDRDPIVLFRKWYLRARKGSGLKDPNAMCVSTADVRGRPDARMVLLKDFDARGFVFYTNFTSPKGRQIVRNPDVCLTFHWDKMGLQVRIRGKAAKVKPAEADAYFRTRPRLSQIGAWASLQSRPLSSRARLLARAAQVAHKWRGKDIPRPPHWSGFRVSPREMEFWTSRPFRLHDRFLYRKAGSAWSRVRLYP